MTTQKTELPRRYHPALVTLHWFMAAFILMMLAVGRLLFPTLTDAAQETSMAKTHMLIGLFLLVLVIVRFIVRLRTPKPAPATTGNALLDRIGIITHYLLYILILVMALSGVGTMLAAGLTPILSGSPMPVPEHLLGFPPYAVHGLTGWLLLALLALHIGATGFHLFIKKDNLLARMWFGK
ncbi:MAG: cytochrome b/b6 domain-containing protein [Chloroflexi bacterium]|nr:cytochrome b/b6 domain-containing protein [Chloroflexota bacterium]